MEQQHSYVIISNIEYQWTMRDYEMTLRGLIFHFISLYSIFLYLLIWCVVNGIVAVALNVFAGQ